MDGRPLSIRMDANKQGKLYPTAAEIRRNEIGHSSPVAHRERSPACCRRLSLQVRGEEASVPRTGANCELILLH